MKKIITLTLLGAGVLFGCGSALADAGTSAAVMSLPDELGMIGLGAAGLLVNRTSLDRVFTGLKTTFHNALTAAQGNWMKTAMETPSTGKGEDYAWLERFPKMRKWVGDKYVKALEAGKYYVKNDDYETTIEVDRNDIEDDSLGIYSTQSQMAGQSAAELNDDIVDDLKNNAFTKTCIDGQFFYDTDHEVQDASVSNKLTVALSAATPAAAKASYGLARQMMMKFKDEEGQPLRLMPNILEVGPALEEVGKILLNNPKLENDAPNPYQGTAELVVNPALTSDTQWMLHCTTRPVMPFIVQVRKRPTFVSQTDMNADDVFNKRKYKYGAEARAAGLYGFWQTSVGSTGAG